MATLDLPDHLIKSLSVVLEQLHQMLPEPKQETDFSAPAFRWQDKQLKPIYQPKAMHLDDLKGIERQVNKIYKIQNSFCMGFLPMIFCSQVHVVQANLRLFAHCSRRIKIKAYV